MQTQAKQKENFGWTAEKNIDDMCKDSWNYIEKSQGSQAK